MLKEGWGQVTPADLRNEGDAAAVPGQPVSYGRDKEWRSAKAGALRTAADRLELDLVPWNGSSAARAPRRRIAG